MPRKTKVTIHNGIIMTRPPVVGHKRKFKDLDGSARSRKVSSGSLVIMHKTRADACIQEWNERYYDHPNSTPGQDKERIAQLLSIPITLQCSPECGKTIGLGTRQWSPTLLCSNFCPLRKFCEGAISENVKAETARIINQRNDKYFKGGCPIIPMVRPSLLKMTLDRVDLLKCLCEPKNSNPAAPQSSSINNSPDNTPPAKRCPGATPKFEPEVTVEEEKGTLLLERLEPEYVSLSSSSAPPMGNPQISNLKMSSSASDEVPASEAVLNKPIRVSATTLEPMDIDASSSAHQQENLSVPKLKQIVTNSISSQRPPLLYAERRSHRGTDHTRMRRNSRKRKRSHTSIAKIKNPEDFRMLCIVELPWLKPSQHHYHIDVGITGWGKGEESETHWRTAVRETYEESLVDITLLCKQSGFRVIPVNICGRLNQKTFICFAPEPFKESIFPIVRYRSLLSRSFERIFESTLRLTTGMGSSTALTPQNSSVTAEPPDCRTKRKYRRNKHNGVANKNLTSQFSKPENGKTAIGKHKSSPTLKNSKDPGSLNQEELQNNPDLRLWTVTKPDLVCKYWLRNDCWRNAFCQYAHSRNLPERFRYYTPKNCKLGGGLPQEFISGRAKRKTKRTGRKRTAVDIALPPRGYDSYLSPPDLVEEEKTLAYIEPIPLRSNSVSPEPTSRSLPSSECILQAPEDKSEGSKAASPSDDLSRLSFLCGPMLARLRDEEQKRRNSESESGHSTPPCPNQNDDVEIIPFILRIRPRPWRRRLEMRRSQNVELNDGYINRSRESTLPDKKKS